MDQKEKEDKIIKSIIPKISDYFIDKPSLTKDKLSEFLEYIDLNIWNSDDEKEVLWNALTVGNKEEKVQKITVIKNLSDFIHSNGKEIFQPEKSLENSVRQYFNNSSKIAYSNNIEQFDEDLLYEFYKLLSVIQYNDNKTIFFYEIEQYLKEYPFLNIKLEQIIELLEKITNEKVTEIKKDLYFNLMEQLRKHLNQKIIENTQNVKTFNEDELNNPELSNLNYIIDFSNIILKLNDSELIIKKNLMDCQNENDKIKIEYYSQYFNSINGAIQVYIYEIQRIYNEQKQKFEYYNYRINTKLNMLKEENNTLENKYKSIKEDLDKNSKENLQIVYDELNDVKNQNEKLKNDILNLQKELLDEKKNNMEYENKLGFSEKNNEELKSKYNVLEKEKEILNNHYTKLLAEFNGKIFQEHQEEEKKKESLKSNENLTEEQKKLIAMNKETLTSYMIERDNYCNQLEEINKSLKSKIENYEQLQEKYEKEITDLKISLSAIKIQNDQLKQENEQLNRDLNDYKLGKSNVLSNLLKDDADFDSKNNNSEKILIKENLSPLFIKFSYRKETIAKKPFKKINFDFLGLKTENIVIQNLDYEYYNERENLVFSEYIKYIDPEKEQTDCILFITPSFFYLLNKQNYKICFKISIILLKTINASTENNIISLTFDSGNIVIFEIFRVLEFIKFFQTLNAIERGNNYAINVNGYNNSNFDKKKKKNYSNTPFYGNAILSSYLKKRYDQILQSVYHKRFVALCDIGLIVMDEPQGKPLEIINPLLAEIHEFNDKKELCFELCIGKIKHTFSASNNTLRQRWRDELEKWILTTYNDEIISV